MSNAGKLNNLGNYLYQPREVSIETLTLCNADCTFCPYSTLDRKRTEMHVDTLGALIGECMSWKLPFYISPFKVNEPLLDSRLPILCRMIERTVPLARIRLFTNGTALTAENIRWIGKLTNIEHLWVSLNSTDAKEHQELMRFKRPMLQKILDNLIELGEQKFPHAVVLSRVEKDRDSDMKFLKDCERWFPKFQAKIIKRDGWLGYVEPGSPAIPDTGCVRWFELSILSTGKVSLCCMDGKGEFSLGDVNKNSMLEIYNQPLLLSRRTHFFSRKAIHPCSTCTY